MDVFLEDLLGILSTHQMGLCINLIFGCHIVKFREEEGLLRFCNTLDYLESKFYDSFKMD